MSQRQPHPYAQFSLKPVNLRAYKATERLKGKPFAYNCGTRHDIYSLGIGKNIRPNGNTLAVIGSKGADIQLSGRDISGKQCSFEIVAQNGPGSECIMVYDYSINQNTKFIGPNALPFDKHGRTRHVVITPGANERISLGKPSDPLLFYLDWHKCKYRLTYDFNFECTRPDLARTLHPSDAENSMTPLGVETLIPLGKREDDIKFSQIGVIAEGGYGTVYEVRNIHSGLKMALKKIPYPGPDKTTDNHKIQRKYANREIEASKKLVHPHLVEFVHVQTTIKWEEVGIFLLPKAGSIGDLIRKKVFESPIQVHTLLHQMLQVIDYIASKDCIHRDVKPDNILFTVDRVDSDFTIYHFQLCDLGMVNTVRNAVTQVGTKAFMAPELWEGEDSRQSSKLDVWSLFATIVYAADRPRGIRDRIDELIAIEPPFVKMMTSLKECVLSAADDPFYRDFRGMAEVDPDKRSSAGDVIDDMFGGEGRITKRKGEASQTIIAEPTALRRRKLAHGTLRTCAIRAKRQG